MKQKIIIIGSGGHSKVVIDILLQEDLEILGIADNNSALIGKKVLGIEVKGDDDWVLSHGFHDILLVNGIGSTSSLNARQQIFERFKSIGYNFHSVVHSSAIISKDVVLHEGVQIMAGAIIQAGSIIGENSIINTKASVDHDCCIAKNCHLAPGVTLSGNVEIGYAVHVGTGATVIQNTKIGNNSLVAAGAVVIKDVEANTVVAGVPAKELK